MYKENQEKMQDIGEFNRFTTYFTGYNKNRENMYSEEDKSTAISYRLINENLPTFIDNIKIYKKIVSLMPEDIEKIYKDLEEYIQVDSIDEIFNISYYNDVLTQRGIECYNILISGRTKNDGDKIKGLNEYINEFNQTHNEKIPKLQELYKQILSDAESASFKIDVIKNDKELMNLIEVYYANILPILNKIEDLFTRISNYNLELILVNNDGTLSTLSNMVFNEWSYIKGAISEKYDEKYSGKEKYGTEKYAQKKQEYLKNRKFIL